MAGETDLDKARLERARYGLDEAERSRPFEVDPGIPLLIGELRAWLQDDRQWIGAFKHQWISLLDDCADAHAHLGENLARNLGQTDGAWVELEGCRAALNKSKARRAPDPAIRRRLERATNTIQSALLDPGVLSAIWNDLVEASDFQTARAEARRLWLFVDAHGLDPEAITKDLRRILRDDLAAIKEARGEPIDRADHNERAGLSADERIEVARDRLFDPQRHVDAVLWLKYTLAPMSVERLELGRAVTLYSARWLRSALLDGDDSRLPEELREAADDSHIALLANAPFRAEGEDAAEEEDVEEEIPDALIRVELGKVSTTEALPLARDTAEFIVSLSSIHGGEPSTWAATKSFIRYYDGRESGASFHAPPVAGLSYVHRQALRSDPMPEVVNEWADDLPAHLPIRRPDLRRAAQLALWLRRSRESWEPARIVLCDRIFEQIAGWAGVTDRRLFTTEYLRTSWALRRIRLEISNCWAAVYNAARLNFDSSLSPEHWDEIANDEELGYEPGAGGRYTIDLRGVLRRLDFLLERVERATPLHERLAELKRRTISGQAAATWVGELVRDFDAFQGRERRVRNCLVHGGPIDDEMAVSVILVMDWLAAEALHTAIKGMLSGGDLIDYFLDRREEYERCLRRLQRNESPAEAMFWK